MIVDDEHIKWAEKHLKDKIKVWKTTDIGQFVIGKAYLQAEKAKSDLMKLNPEKSGFTDDVVKIQREYNNAITALLWLEKAIEEGEMAEQQLEMGE